jgi:hypothetical protein
MTRAQFRFKEAEDQIEVYCRGKKLGTIVGMLEASGRPCYRLGVDTRREPRTYRGRERAAEVLQVIDSLKRQAEKSKWSFEELIVRAWDAKPSTTYPG